MKIINKKKLIEKYIQRCQIKDDDYFIISSLYENVKDVDIFALDVMFNKYEDLIVERS